jgi:phenylacetic acid degradation operon negative regulatory protein
MTARSVLLSVLLGSDPPRLPVQLLVRTTELFGIAEGTTRTALSRMAAGGEVVADDGWYALAADRLLARQARQAASRSARTRPWRGGRWRQAVVVADGRRPAADRASLRASLAAARLAELREGVWLRPDNLEPVVPDADELRWSTLVPDGDPTTLANELWDLHGWATTTAQLRSRMGELVGPLEGGDRSALADGFVLSADVLRHLQADPLLPAALLPDDWPGHVLRREYDRYDRAYRSVLRAFFRARR